MEHAIVSSVGAVMTGVDVRPVPTRSRWNGMHRTRFAPRMIVVATALVALGAAIGWVLAPDAPRVTKVDGHATAAQIRDAEVLARDAGWNEGRKQGRTEMQFLAQYEQLRADARKYAVAASVG